jgi:replicative DNA helicase
VVEGTRGALALDTVMPTPRGWVTVEAARIGDWLFDEHGYPTRVRAVGLPVRSQLRSMRFDDGAEVSVGTSHAWVAANLGRRNRARAETADWRSRWSITETVQTEAFHRRAFVGKSHTSNWSIPLGRSLDLPTAPLPIPPWVLGAWLGDGCASSATMTTCDAWMMDEFRREGMAVTSRAARKDGSVDFGFRPQDGAKSHVTSKGRGKTVLRAAGVLDHKLIPAVYLRASREQRLGLLQGYMDTDGFRVARGAVAIEQRSEVLARGLVELIRSLGWRAFITRQRRPHPQLPGDVYRFWQVNFRPDVCPFRLPRKAATWRREASWHARFTHRTLVDIGPARYGWVRHVEVESHSGLALAGPGMIPTRT